MTDQSHTQLVHRASERADWSRKLAPVKPRPARPDWPEWVRFAIFYLAVFVVLGGWISAFRTLVDILRANGVLH